jgi:glycosyltransferase involved in cell wall biosynthesis
MDLSVVVPIYNEIENVDELYRRIKIELQKLSLTHEIIFVDDGSTDGTTAKIKEMKEHEPELKLAIFDRNYGQTQAMVAGFQLARGDMIISMDGDLQNDPADIVQIVVNLCSGYDMVSGWRKAREDNVILRKIPSKIANALISRVTEVKIHDLGCSLKGFKRKIAQNIILYPEMHRFIPIFAASIGARIKEVQVTHKPRVRGQSKYGIARTWRVILDLIKIKVLMDFSHKPSKLFAAISIPFWIIGVSLMGRYLVEYFRETGLFASSIVYMGTGTLYVYLAFSLVSFGFITELLCVTREYRQDKILGNILSSEKKWKTAKKK